MVYFPLKGTSRGWAGRYPAETWHRVVSAVVHYRIYIFGTGGQLPVTLKGTGGEIGAARTWMLWISCTLLTHPLWLLSQRNGWAGPLQWQIC